MSLTLIGYMGSGKTSQSKRLGNRLNMPVYDLDSEIETYAQSSITEIFRDLGEDAFRDIETRLLKRLIDGENKVLSLGGGTPCNDDNLSLIINNTFSVYLKMDAKMAFSRLKKSKSKRPIIAGLEGEALSNFIEKQITDREIYYNKANLIVHADDLTAKTLDEIKSAYQKWANQP